MRHLISTSGPAMIFVGVIALFYVSYVGMWVRFIHSKFRSRKTPKIASIRSLLIWHLPALLGIACFLYALYVEPYWPQITYVTLQTDKIDHTTFRVVQFSDTHCDPKVRLEERLPNLINELNPDIIVFTGDAINSPDGRDNFQTMLKKMDAPLGKFAIRGNWDISFWSQVDLFGGTGFREMKMDKELIQKDGDFMTVAGLSYEKGPESQGVVGKLKKTDYNLFLYHNTDMIDYFGDKPIDLYLCGHTHGGQVALPFYGALMTLSRHGKKYEAGLYKVGDIDLYVNRGIGMEGGQSPRMRFCARPEITVFDIGPTKHSAR